MGFPVEPEVYGCMQTESGSIRRRRKRGEAAGEPRVPFERAVGRGRVRDEVGEPLDLARQAPGALRLVAAGDQDRRLRVLDDVGERLVPHPDVQGNGDGADPHGPQERGQEPPVVREHEGDPVARAHAEPGQGVRRAVAPAVEVLVRERRVALDDRHRRRGETQGDVEQVTQGVGEHREAISFRGWWR